RSVSGQRPETRRIGSGVIKNDGRRRGWKRQDVAIIAVERLACAVAKRVVIQRRVEVVAELAKLGYRRTIDRIAESDVVGLPIANIGEMSPVGPDLMPVDIVIHDLGVSCLSTVTERGVVWPTA